jgi:branched-chain amino acid transport system permease protein
LNQDIFFQTIVNGLFTGGIYATVAIGLTLIYGVMLIMNFAHGEFLMLGMYIAYWLFTSYNMDPYLAAPIAAVIIFALGAILQRTVIQRILSAHPLNQIILMLGISTLIIGLVQFFLTAEPRTIHVAYETSVITVMGMRLTIPRLIGFLVCMAMSIVLFLFLQFTKTGKAIRAVSQSRTAAWLMGVDVNFIYMLTFGIGAAVTAVGGVLLSTNYKMIPTIGQSFGVIAFVVVVLGTMGNFIGAFVGGLIIGIVEAFAGYFLGGDVKIIASMFVFILILLFKPSGLFGRKSA